MAKQIRCGIPEDTVKAEDHLVQVAKAQPLDGVLLPRGQRRIKLDRVHLMRRRWTDGHLQHAQGQSAQHQVGCNEREEQE